MPAIRTSRTNAVVAPSQSWTVGEVARRVKCSLRTIRFYEQQGLVVAQRRTGGRHRRYAERDVERLRLVVELRRAGLALDEIRAIVATEARHATGAAAAELRRLLALQIAALSARVSGLMDVKTELEQLHEALSVCESCRRIAEFPDACVDCASLTDAAGGTALMRALWSPPP